MTRPDRDRLRKIHRWLACEFPTRWDVLLRVVKRMPPGHEEDIGAYFPRQLGHPSTIYLWAELSRREAIDTLIHEWAHATVDPEAWGSVRAHGGHTIMGFYPQLGRIDRAFQKAVEGPLKDRSRGGIR